LVFYEISGNFSRKGLTCLIYVNIIGIEFIFKEVIPMANLNKSNLVNAISESTKLSKKDSEAALNATIDAISGALKKGNKVVLVGFGTFEVRARAARKGRNPQTGAEIKIKASKAPAFKAGKALKDLVN